MTIEPVNEALRGPVTASAGPALPEEVAARIAGTIQRSRAENTRRAYTSDWDRFVTWCFSHGHTPLPAHPMVVAAYLIDAADTYTQDGERAYSPATLSRWVAALGHHHRRAGHPAPGGNEIVAAPGGALEVLEHLRHRAAGTATTSSMPSAVGESSVALAIEEEHGVAWRCSVRDAS